jgi:hypothetical protein
MSALGTEFKLNVHLEPLDGLHMSDYDFEVALYVYTNRKVVFQKSKLKKVDDDNYLLMVETADALRIGRGRINAEITAYIPDNDFCDGLRTEKLVLCTDVTAI